MSRRQKILLAGGVALAGVAAWFAYPGVLAFGPPCPLHSMTGWYCPGCGSTRALHQLVHAHWLAAYRLNPLLVTALPVIGLMLARRQPISAKRGWIVAWLVVVVAFAVLRNLPWYPFNLLAPQP